jgi:hypothetical protein
MDEAQVVERLPCKHEALSSNHKLLYIYIMLNLATLSFKILLLLYFKALDRELYYGITMNINSVIEIELKSSEPSVDPWFLPMHLLSLLGLHCFCLLAFT